MSILDLVQKKLKKPVDISKATILEKLKQHLSSEMIELEATFEQGDLLDCKIGGSYLQPLNAKPLKESMRLLAQINFAQVDFPYAKSGLLQFFIDAEHEMFGLNIEQPCIQEGFCVRYLSLQDLQACKEIKGYQKGYMPFTQDTCYKLVGKKAVQTMLDCDYRFDQCFESLFQFKYQQLSIDERFELMEELDSYNVQMLGYPTFCQFDPREQVYEEYDTLLFQMGSFRDIMIFDGGILNFFIKQKDLEKLDFSNILYNWDCF